MYYVENIVGVLQGNCVLTYNGTKYTSVDEVKAMAKRPGQVIVESIKYENNKFLIALADSPIIENDMSELWVKEYIEQYGHEPSFF